MNTASEARSLPWRPLTAALALLGLLLLTYRFTFVWLEQRYSRPDTLYGHGPLIPLLSGFLIWKDRDALRRIWGPGSWAGLWLVIPALLVHLAATARRDDSPSGLSLLLLIPGLVWLIGGRAALRRLWFPLAFLSFAVPLPMILVEQAALWMKGVVLVSTNGALQLLGAKIEMQGSYLVLESGGRLLVDNECSGLRSLIALLALGLFMAYSSRTLSNTGKWILCISSVVVAGFANFCRVMLLSVLAWQQGTEAAIRWHDWSGWGVYAVALLVYVGLERVLPSQKDPSP